MAPTLPLLSELDAAQVSQNLEELKAWLAEANPTIDVSSGPLYALLQYYSAAIEAAEQDLIDRIARSDSLEEIEADPSLADADTVDQKLSNWGITRQDSEVAAGQVTLVLSDDVTVFVAAGARFEASGQTYRTEQAFVAKAEADLVISNNDRLLTRLSDGNYAFTIDVVAVTPGEDGTLKRGTAVVPTSPPPNFVRGYATSDFTPGRNVETTSELLSQLRQGVSAKTFVGSTNLLAAIREDFPDNLVAASVVGCGSPEMQRDAHTIIPTSFGGKVDIYLRTEAALHRFALEKTATLVEKGEDYGIWQVSIGRDDVPGFYKVDRIALTGDDVTNFDLESDTRGRDLSGNGFIPDIQSQAEAAYTRFQTSVIRFRDTTTDHTSLSVGDTAQYDLEILGQPQIGAIHDHFNAKGVRSEASDILLRAPVPCFVQLSLTIYKLPGADDPDIDAIKVALTQTVNKIGYTGRLPASKLQDVVHGFLENEHEVSPIDMFAEIWRPDGTRAFDNSFALIEVPDEPLRGVTANTVQFFCEERDIAISIASAGTAQI